MHEIYNTTPLFCVKMFFVLLLAFTLLVVLCFIYILAIPHEGNRSLKIQRGYNEVDIHFTS